MQHTWIPSTADSKGIVWKTSAPKGGSFFCCSFWVFGVGCAESNLRHICDIQFIWIKLDLCNFFGSPHFAGWLVARSRRPPTNAGSTLALHPEQVSSAEVKQTAIILAVDHQEEGKSLTLRWVKQIMSSRLAVRSTTLSLLLQYKNDTICGYASYHIGIEHKDGFLGSQWRGWHISGKLDGHLPCHSHLIVWWFKRWLYLLNWKASTEATQDGGPEPTMQHSRGADGTGLVHGPVFKGHWKVTVILAEECLTLKVACM